MSIFLHFSQALAWATIAWTMISVALWATNDDRVNGPRTLGCMPVLAVIAAAWLWASWGVAS